ncbi:hypothetical protein [Pseudomonas alkylphenolica]|uniref:hypothetical protein n=1 Tax=Pseudomonas alkylphenolica TaxID=237609 RepID=UPI000FEB7700|nr:hypothetical protein [Pseudomonas alkylphenolica]
MSSEKHALVLIGDRVACFESTTASDEQWNATLIHGEPWVSFSSHSAQTVGSVLKQLSERRNLHTQLAKVDITVIYEQAAARHLADVSQACIELQCATWEVLRYEPLVERLGLSPAELPRPHDGAWLVEHVLAQLGAPQPTPEPVASVASSASDVADLPDVALLQLYLPLLFQNFWSSISPQDLAFICGSLQIPDVESPYPEPSQEAIAVLRRRFLKLPVAQRSVVLGIAQELTYKLKVRTQLRDLLEVL